MEPGRCCFGSVYGYEVKMYQLFGFEDEWDCAHGLMWDKSSAMKYIVVGVAGLKVWPVGVGGVASVGVNYLRYLKFCRTTLCMSAPLPKHHSIGVGRLP